MAEVPVAWGQNIRLPDGQIVSSESLRMCAKNGQKARPTVEKAIGWGDSVKLPDGSIITHTWLRTIAENKA